jgi:ribonucleotide reductase beta subunit family protein with ferritin-like domain
MTGTVFGNELFPKTLFLDRSQGATVQRFDNPRYKVILDLFTMQLEKIWRPEEIDMTNDRTNFPLLTKAEEHIVISNIKRQILLDSIMGRAPTAVFNPAVADPSLECVIQTWSLFECLAEGAEVLTDKGWIDIKDVTMETMVAQYRSTNRGLYWTHPEKIHVYDKNEELVRFKSANGNFEQFVTKNHRMPFVTYDSFGFEEADKFEPHEMVGLPLTGTAFEDEEFSADFDAITAAKVYATVLGYHLKTDDGIPDELHFYGKNKYAADLLSNLAKPSFVFDDRIEFQLDGAIKDVYHNRLTDILPLSSMSYLKGYQLLGLIKNMAEASGKDNLWIERKEIVDDIQALLFMSGIHSTYKEEDGGYVLYISHDDTVRGDFVEKTYEQYEGKVYCLTVPTGAFVIRYKGIPSITGNCLHSFSYTHIIQQSFVNPKETLDTVMDIQEIVQCKDSICKYYDDAIQKVQDYYEGRCERIEAVRALWLALHTANALESIRFQVSFACSFIFGQMGKLPGLARIIKLINRDENIHVAITNNLLSILPVDDIDFLMVSEEEDVKCAIEGIWRDAIMEELDWCKYLFKEGEIFAFNQAILEEYLRYLATARLKRYNLPPLEELCGLQSVTKNPIPWVTAWNGEEKEQVAPQEAEKTDYERGIIDKSQTNYGEILVAFNKFNPEKNQ